MQFDDLDRPTNCGRFQTGTAIDGAAREGHHAPGKPGLKPERQHGPTIDSTAITQEGLPAALVGGAVESEPGDDEDAEYRSAAPDPLEADQAAPAMPAPPVLPAATHAGPHAGATWNADGPAHLPSAD
ncbi:MAG: hypothetical protein R3C56_32120 [Pirellulaceae bacterium]